MAKIIDVINYEGNNETFIFRHPNTDFNIGAQLIVHESQEAVFFRDGKALDSFGPGRHALETNNIPILKNSINSLADGENVFHSEVYFVNLTTQLGVKWGTDSKVRLFDPISGLHLEIGASGTFNLKVQDGRKLLIKIVGTTGGFLQDDVFGPCGYSTEKTIGKFRGLIISKVKTFLAKTIRENDINILEIDEHIDELSLILKEQINLVLTEYGLVVPEFFITNIVTPDDDPNYMRMRDQHAERYLKVQQERIRLAEANARREREIVEAETDAKKKIIISGGEAEAYRLKAQAEAEEMKMKGYTYHEETTRQVGVAAAENESGGAAGGIASDIVRTGVGIGAAISVMGAAKEAFDPMVKSSAATLAGASWDCSCGQKNNTGNFCQNCGKMRGK